MTATTSADTARRVTFIDSAVRGAQHVPSDGRAISEIMLAAAERMNDRGESLLDALENAIDFGA